MRYTARNNRFIQLADELIGGTTRSPLTKAHFDKIAKELGITPSVYVWTGPGPKDFMVDAIPFLNGIDCETTTGKLRVDNGYLLYCHKDKEVYPCGKRMFHLFHNPHSD